VPARAPGSVSVGEGGRPPQTRSREVGSRRGGDRGLEGRENGAARSSGRLRWHGGDSGGPRWSELGRTGRGEPAVDGIQGRPSLRRGRGSGGGGGPWWPELGRTKRGEPPSTASRDDLLSAAAVDLAAEEVRGGRSAQGGEEPSATSSKIWEERAGREGSVWAATAGRGVCGRQWQGGSGREVTGRVWWVGRFLYEGGGFGCISAVRSFPFSVLMRIPLCRAF
jgi:hypothetical protein